MFVHIALDLVIIPIENGRYFNNPTSINTHNIERLAVIRLLLAYPRALRLLGWKLQLRLVQINILIISHGVL